MYSLVIKTYIKTKNIENFLCSLLKLIKIEIDMDQKSEITKTLLSHIKKSYVLISWPESQEYMGKEWFNKEAILYQANENQEYLDSAYFIPLERLIEY